MFTNPRQRYEARMSETRQLRKLALWMRRVAIEKHMQGIYVNAKSRRVLEAKQALYAAKRERRQHPAWFGGAR